jgi:hypothetical protein
MRYFSSARRTALDLILRYRFASHLRGKQLAIVGNAPTEVGLGRGKEIDSADLVVRFNNFSLAPEHIPDYGSRTDLWVTSLNKDLPFTPEAFTWVCCPLPLTSPKWLQRYTATSWTAWLKALRSGCVFSSKRGFERLIKDVPNPSTGLSFLHWITECMSEPVQFKLYGFSFFDPNQAHHYFDEDDRCGHEGDKEREHFERHLRSRSV